MAEYIEKEALMFALCKEIIGDGDYYNGKDDMQDEIRDMVSRLPPADVVPVRHGRWIKHDDGVFTCSECENAESNESYFCRYCGAKMMEG